jgi:excisionase family DNA binding protein
MIAEIGHLTKRALTIEAFCERYSVGRTFTYGEIAKGRLKSVSLGRKRLIHVDDAENWFASFRNAPEAIAA